MDFLEQKPHTWLEIQSFKKKFHSAHPQIFLSLWASKVMALLHIFPTEEES